MGDMKQAVKLLDRFAAVCGDRPLTSDPGLWRDYYEWTGDHMILTDEGWESGESRPAYERLAKEDGLPLSDFIHCELNPPGFAWALERVLNGCSVRRRAWNAKRVLCIPNLETRDIKDLERGHNYPLTLRAADLLADDWEIAK